VFRFLIAKRNIFFLAVCAVFLERRKKESGFSPRYCRERERSREFESSRERVRARESFRPFFCFSGWLLLRSACRETTTTTTAAPSPLSPWTRMMEQLWQSQTHTASTPNKVRLRTKWWMLLYHCRHLEQVREVVVSHAILAI
jgi:hypothetical protein